jgi:preprotein translocase subunit SecG
MLTFVSIIHVVLCVFMIFVILLQPGKDAGMGAALGGGAATSAFGGRGAVTFLGKVTAVCAIGFFLTALGLSFVGLRTSVGANAPKPVAAAVVADGGTAANPSMDKQAEVPKPPETTPPADAPKPIDPPTGTLPSTPPPAEKK